MAQNEAEAQDARQKELLAKAQQIAALPKSQQKDAVLEAERAADAAHVAKAKAETDAQAAADKTQAEAEEAHAKAVEIIGTSKEALLARLKNRHGARFSHSLDVEDASGDLIILSLVKLDDSERPRRVSTARRIPKAEHLEMSRDEVGALEVEQLHVLAQRLGC